MIWTKTFWKGAGERAVKTWFQVFVAMTMLTAGTEMIPAVGIEGIPWVAVLSSATLSAVLSLATSIGNAEFTAGQF